MKKLALTGCICLLVQHYCLSQVPVYDTLNPTTTSKAAIINHISHFNDSLLQDYYGINNQFINGTVEDGLTVMPRSYFDKFIRKYFSYMATEKAGLPDGNSVSFTPTSNSTKLQANLARKSNTVIYNAGFSADFSDNIANLFSESDVTSNTAFYINLSFLRRKHSLIEFDANKAFNNNQNKIMLVRQFANGFNLKYLSDYEQDLSTYNKTKQQLDTLIKQPDFVQQIDSIRTKILRLKNDLGQLMLKIKSYGLNEWDALYAQGADTLLEKKFRDSLTTILDTAEINNNTWSKFRFSWFSGGLTYTRQQYGTYDSAIAFDKRVDDLTFNNVGLTLSFNYFSQRSADDIAVFKGIGSVYINGSYTLANDVNYAHLDEQDFLKLQQVSNPDSSSNTIYQFQKASKLRNISGKKKEIDWLHTFSVQSILSFGKSSFMGVDMGLTGAYGKLTTPVYNGKLGLLFRFINSDDQKSRLNFELFVQFNDWNDSKASGKSTWQRKLIGLSTTIPFNKLFF